ncbi:hypothetical protein [Shewanella litorisediminis]|uniref:Uncharacterized protein n=1 Tax=Shewanella litorisediminis TaxID=1173586 RepID=A0ABX7G2W3_9GAMM|nr:hypothetical protein [Shewanella litorisediminis]MCL2917208.1 hypothetical protein [Shewanella litorisediminis]QRH01682.1 hypothetical protein JQC75_17850 [Shewanella litorisediminis]
MSLRLPHLALKLLLITMLLGQILTPVQAFVSIVKAPMSVSMGHTASDALSHDVATPSDHSQMSTMMMTGKHNADCRTYCASGSQADCASHCTSSMGLPVLALHINHHHSRDAIATASWSLITFTGSLQTPPPDLA